MEFFVMFKTKEDFVHFFFGVVFTATTLVAVNVENAPYACFITPSGDYCIGIKLKSPK
jgi:hypothetical protein